MSMLSAKLLFAGAQTFSTKKQELVMLLFDRISQFLLALALVFV
jgi:hypothetical protein